MHRTDVPKVLRNPSSQRSHDDSFEKEDSPNLPVPPRRKTNTLSMLRKLFDEYDDDQLEDSAQKNLLNPSYNIHQCADDDVPDHCWVGEYLDGDDEVETPGYSSHVSATLRSLRAKSQNLPSSSGSALSSSGVSNETFSTRRDISSSETNFDDATHREIKELQRKERARKEQLYKIMLESLEYKAELARLKREASLKESKESAKVFEYGHGSSDQSHRRPISQPVSHSSTQREINRYPAREVPQSSFQQHSNLSLEDLPRHSVNVFQSELASLFSRKIVVYPPKSDTTYESQSETQRMEIYHRGYYDNHSSGPTLDRPGTMPKVIKSLRNRDMVEESANNSEQEYPSPAGAMSSFGSALAQTAKISKNDSSQKYEDYLDELELKLQEENLAKNPPRPARPNEGMQGKSSKMTPVFRESEGLPISVLTSVERAGSRIKYESAAKNTSARATPPLKIKPALKNVHKDVFKKDMRRSSSLIESIEEINATPRLNLGNFNDTRRVLMEDAHHYDRDDDISKPGYDGRVVIDRETRHRASLINKTFSHNIHSNGSVKLRDCKNQRIQSKLKSSGPMTFDASEAVGEEYDDYEFPLFLHRTRPKDYKKDIIKVFKKEKSLTQKQNQSKSSRTSDNYALDNKDGLSQGYSSRGLAKRIAITDRSIEPNRKNNPKHVIKMTRTASKQPALPSTHYQRSRKGTDTRIQGYDEDDTDQIDLTYRPRHSSSKSVSRERNIRPSSNAKTLRHEDAATKANAGEYIDQFFDRQIKVWSGSSGILTEQAERLVKRPHHKPHLTWEEEVDRYVNMSAGTDKRVDNARNDKSESGLHRLQRRRRKHSHGDITLAIKRDSKSHSRTPSTSHRSNDSRSPSANRKRNRQRSGNDERRFETIHPLLTTDLATSKSLSSESNTSKVKQTEMYASYEEWSKSQRVKLKKTDSPAPVPLMPSGWRPAKIRKLPNDTERDNRPVSVKRLSKRTQQESKRKVISREVHDEHTRGVTKVEGSCSLKASHSKYVRGIPNSKIRLRLISGRTPNANQKRSLNMTKAANMKARSDHRVISRKTPPLERRSVSDQSRVVTESNPAIASHVPRDGAKVEPKAVVINKDNPEDTVTPKNKVDDSLDSSVEPAEILEDKSATQLPTGMLPVVSGDRKPQNTFTEQDTQECASAATPNTDHAGSNSAEVIVGEKKMEVCDMKPKTASLQKPATMVVGRGRRLIKKPGLKKIVKSSQGANFNSMKTKMFRKKKPLIFVKENSEASNLTKPVKPHVSDVLSSVKDESTAVSTMPMDICVDDRDDNWMTRYRNWFNKVLQSTLSNDEAAKTLGWGDPVEFLKCVTRGNKRAMSYIPRGARAKEMLRFIALNKKVTNNSPVATSKKVKLEEESQHFEVDFGSNCASEVPSNMTEHQKKEAVDGKEDFYSDDTLTAKDEAGSVKIMSAAQQSVQPILSSKNSVMGQSDINSPDPKQPDSDIVKNDDPKHGMTKGQSNDSRQLAVPIAQPKPSSFRVGESNSDTERNGKFLHRDSDNKEESMSDKALLKEPSKPASSQQRNRRQPNKVTQKRKPSPSGSKPLISGTAKRGKLGNNTQKQADFTPNSKKTTGIIKLQSRKNEIAMTKAMPATTQEVKPPPNDLKHPNPQTTPTQKSTLAGNERQRVTIDPDSRKGTKQQPQKSQSMEVSEMPTIIVRSGKESPQKDDPMPTSPARRRQSRPESRQRRRSYCEEITIPTKEPMLNLSQRDLLPAFKKCVERATTRSLNILYEFDEYDKKKLAKVARDILDAFTLSKRRKHGFTIQHSLFYMSLVFKNPPSDSLDDVQRQFKRSDLDGPQFEFTLQAFVNFKDIVISLCKRNLDPKKRSNAQDEVKKRFVHQRSEYLFPQFSFQVDSLLKLWLWSERMQYIFHKESSNRTHVKLEPFPDDAGQKFEDRVVEWLHNVLHRRIYNEGENYSHAVVCAVKTELMKRKSHATRQEALSMVMRLCVKDLFLAIDKSRKSEEKRPEPEASVEDSELIVLDEVYSDESEDENVLDLVDDSESVQIDLF